MAGERILRVVEAKGTDVGRGVARVDPAVMEILRIRRGDAIIIEGRKRTPVLCDSDGCTLTPHSAAKAEHKAA
jgi:transitional endoplasmic reticulum ATPase